MYSFILIFTHSFCKPILSILGKVLPIFRVLNYVKSSGVNFFGETPAWGRMLYKNVLINFSFCTGQMAK